MKAILFLTGVCVLAQVQPPPAPWRGAGHTPCTGSDNGVYQCPPPARTVAHFEFDLRLPEGTVIRRTAKLVGPDRSADFFRTSSAARARQDQQAPIGRRKDEERSSQRESRLFRLTDCERIASDVSEVAQLAEQADGPVYAEAVSAYAGLDGEELRAAASAAVLARDHDLEVDSDHDRDHQHSRDSDHVSGPRRA